MTAHVTASIVNVTQVLPTRRGESYEVAADNRFVYVQKYFQEAKWVRAWVDVYEKGNLQSELPYSLYSPQPLRYHEDFGYSFSSDNRYMVVGDPMDNFGNGSVHVYDIGRTTTTNLSSALIQS